jgi:hypothetical protein
MREEQPSISAPTMRESIGTTARAAIFKADIAPSLKNAGKSSFPDSKSV